VVVASVQARSSSVSKAKERVTSRIQKISIGALCIVVFGCTSPSISPDALGRVHAKIIKVVDGDTVVIRIGRASENVRLIGVNTPETKHPTKPIECYGPEASARTHALLPDGTDVYIVRDAEARDKYGRLLAYVYRTADNLFINLDLIAGGFATPMVFPPNTNKETDFAEAANAAERSNIGLWGNCRR